MEHTMPSTQGFSAKDRHQFDHDGFAIVRNLLDPDFLAEIRSEFDRLWSVHGSCGRVYQQQLLTSPFFIRLVEHPAILNCHRELFCDQVQLLSLDLLRQGPMSQSPDYAWHRDFNFPGDNVLSANTILYLDDITPETGPTRVVPGSHRGRHGPPADQCQGPFANQVEVLANAGDAAIINAAIWHTGGRNRGHGLRRAIYLYYGWWWLKQYHAERGPMPWKALEQASLQRLSLLGLRMPGGDLHMY